MHATSCNIGAFVRTATPDSKVQGYPPSVLSAGTDYGDAVNVAGFKGAILTALVGAATGSPTTQSTKVSLQSAPAGTEAGGTWADVADSEVELTADEASEELDLNLMRLPSGHALARVKVVTAFTGGSSPKQSASAVLTLGGSDTLPV